MIIKDEVKVIARCLASVMPFIDGAAICDTGSTDGTQGVVERVFYEANKPLVFHDHPWQDFSHNRNLALDAARTMCGPEDYLLVMDADDVFHGVVDKASLEAEGYMVKYRLGGFEWTRPTIVRAEKSLGWSYHFKVHEVLLRSRQDDLGLFLLPECRIDCNVGGEYQGREYFLGHAKLLEGESDPRSVYYLAQSYHCAGEIEKAIKTFAQRTQMNDGYAEETLVAWLRLGQLTNDPGCFLEAAAMNASRPEGFFYAAEWCHSKNLDEVAKVMLDEALKRINPIGMFIEKDVLRRAQLLRLVLNV